MKMDFPLYLFSPTHPGSDPGQGEEGEAREGQGQGQAQGEEGQGGSEG